VIEVIWVEHGNGLIRIVLWGMWFCRGGGGFRFQEMLGKSAFEVLVIVRSVMVPEKKLNSL
jgi:hypothetical protein